MQKKWIALLIKNFYINSNCSRVDFFEQYKKYKVALVLLSVGNIFMLIVL